MNSVAVITGGSRGIGRAIATYLASQKYDVVLVARNEDKLAGVAHILAQQHGVSASAYSVDVTDFHKVQELLEETVGKHGKIDVLVNAAGIFRFGTSELETDELGEMLNTNLLAIHNLCSLVSKRMVSNGNGRIINIASIAGKEAFSQVGGYCASKYGMVGYSQSLAKELLPFNVKVTVICPDVVNTDMSAGSGLDASQMIDTSDIVRTVDYLMSLSSEAVVDEVTIKCKTIIEQSAGR